MNGLCFKPKNGNSIVIRNGENHFIRQIYKNIFKVYILHYVFFYFSDDSLIIQVII